MQAAGRPIALRSSRGTFRYAFLRVRVLLRAYYAMFVSRYFAIKKQTKKQTKIKTKQKTRNKTHTHTHTKTTTNKQQKTDDLGLIAYC